MRTRNILIAALILAIAFIAWRETITAQDEVKKPEAKVEYAVVNLGWQEGAKTLNDKAAEGWELVDTYAGPNSFPVGIFKRDKPHK